MHRDNLLQLLENYHPKDTNELKSKEKIISFVKQYKDCFERTLDIGHIVASCWLVNHDNSKALLTHHKKLNEWLQLGGHCDGNPNVLDVAIKEAQEESGILDIQPLSHSLFYIDVHRIPEYKNEKEHYHYNIVFLLQAASDKPTIVSEESYDLLWIDKNIHSLPSQEPTVKRMFDKWILLQ